MKSISGRPHSLDISSHPYSGPLARTTHWNKPLTRPIALKNDVELLTLADAGQLILVVGIGEGRRAGNASPCRLCSAASEVFSLVLNALLPGAVAGLIRWPAIALAVCDTPCVTDGSCYFPGVR